MVLCGFKDDTSQDIKVLRGFVADAAGAELLAHYLDTGTVDFYQGLAGHRERRQVAAASKEQADFNRHFGAKSPTTARSTRHSSHMGPDMVEQPEQHSREEPEATVVQAWRAKYQAGMVEKEQKKRHSR